jgi:hypothetical protein
LEVLLHELVHAGFWDLDEESVDQFSKDASKVIFKFMEDEKKIESEEDRAMNMAARNAGW